MKCTAAFFRLSGLFTILLLPTILRAQPASAPGRPDMSFGNVLPENFTPPLFGDSTPRAVYLFDQAQVGFEEDRINHRGFSVVFQRHTRILILHKSAFNLASFTLSTYRKGETSIEGFQGMTYNLENGAVVASKLDKSNIFKDRNTNFDLEKIAFPNVREGSIIEYSFTIIYPGIGYVPAWNFQGPYPIQWSEYDITVPRLFDYAVKNQGYQKYALDTTIVYDNNNVGLSYGVSSRTFYANQSVRHIWALQNAPAMEKPEPYTTTLKNHLNRLEFQLSSALQNGYRQTYSTTWPQLTRELLKNDNFGSQLTDRNRWMDDDLKKICTGATPATNARLIFAWVRDNFTTMPTDRIYLTQPLKKTWDDKRAPSIADINLLLTAIYRHQGLDASPVLLSTRTNGYTNDSYPLLSEYNYIVTRLRSGGKSYLLDASRTWLGFDQIPEMCYNGNGHAIDSSHDLIPLFPDSITESRQTYVVLANTDSGYSGSYSRKAGTFESMGLRNQLKRIKPEEFFENFRHSTPNNGQMGKSGFDSLDVPEARITWHYGLKYNFTQKTVYFNPIMHERFNTSPFGPEERNYPVEMNSCIDNSYTLNMEIPKGYIVEQLPASQRVVLEDSSGYFEYNMSSDGHAVSFHLNLRLKKAVYSVAEYAALRSFFTYVAKKEKEPIIFKKISS